MLNFQFHTPTEFVFGRGTENLAGELVKKYGGTKVLIHYGGGSALRTGLYDKTVKSLEAAGLKHVALGGARPNPVDTLVYEGIELARREGVDFILGVGGGSAIDSSKAIAAGVPYEGDFWDFFAEKASPAKTIRLGCIVTLPATGTEGSDSAVITRSDGMLKRGMNSRFNRPLFSIMNPELTFTLPPWQTASGIADMMAHIMERYFTNTRHVDVTDRLGEALLTSIVNQAGIVMREPENYDARAEIMWAGTLAHNNLCGVGRETDFSVHKLEHELSAKWDVTHGAGLAALYPAWMQYQMPQNPMRLAQFAARVFGAEMNFEDPTVTAWDGIRRLAAFYTSIGMPVNLRELDARIGKSDIPELVAKVRRKKDGTVGSFRPLAEADLKNVFELAFDWKP
ncbi:MAG: iron-containing alcohol dehydrogenase [Candidatus Accumulibacter sp.]|jgi:alcohol dehydrogenase YqhD (iron-dependent ADH family)|nr:iron-containing alcohol dehydrogenase [Accumulibacter sp.]